MSGKLGDEVEITDPELRKKRLAMYDSTAVQDPELGLALIPKLGKTDEEYRTEVSKAQQTKKAKKLPDDVSWKTVDSKSAFEQAQAGDHIYLQDKEGRVMVVPRGHMSDEQWRKHVDKASKRDDFVSAKLGDQNVYNANMTEPEKASPDEPQRRPQRTQTEDDASIDAAPQSAARGNTVGGQFARMVGGATPQFDSQGKQYAIVSGANGQPRAVRIFGDASNLQSRVDASQPGVLDTAGDIAKGIGQTLQQPSPSSPPASELAEVQAQADMDTAAQTQVGASPPVGGGAPEGAPAPSPVGPSTPPIIPDVQGPNFDIGMGGGQPPVQMGQLDPSKLTTINGRGGVQIPPTVPPPAVAPPPVGPAAAEAARIQAQLATPMRVGVNPKIESYQPVLDSLEGARQTEQAGIKAQTEAQVRINDAQALVQAQTMQNLQSLEAMRQRAAQTQKEYTDKMISGMWSVQQELSAPSRKIDPDRYWKNKDDGTKFLNVIAGACFGFAGQGMQWLQHLDSLVERDVRAQQMDIENDRSRLQMKAQGYQSMYQMYREQGLDAQSAFAASKASMLEVAQQQMNLIAKQSGSDLIRANAQQQSGKLDQAIAMQRLQATQAMNATSMQRGNLELEALKANLEFQQKAMQMKLSTLLKGNVNEDIPAEALKGLETSRGMFQQAIDFKKSLPKGFWDRIKTVDAAMKNKLPGGQLLASSEGTAVVKKISALREGIMKAVEGNALQKQEVDRLLAALPEVDSLNGLGDQSLNMDQFIKVADEIHGSKLKTMQMGLPKHNFSQELEDYRRLQQQAGTVPLRTFQPMGE